MESAGKPHLRRTSIAFMALSRFEVFEDAGDEIRLGDLSNHA